jgi:hypothetical protein
MITNASRLAAGLAAGVLVLLALAGCIQGQGPIVSEMRDVRPFSRLEVGSGIHVVLTTGDVTALAVSAQESILPTVATEVSGTTLTIEARRDFTSAEAVTVTVTTPRLDAISMSGGAQLRGDALAIDALALDVRGGARVTLAGTGHSVTLVGDSGSTIELGGLAADTVDVSLDGGASASVRATSRVSGSASGGAHLSVAGDGSVNVRTSGGASIGRAGGS